LQANLVLERAIEEEASQTRYREGADCHFKSENVNGRQGGSSVLLCFTCKYPCIVALFYKAMEEIRRKPLAMHILFMQYRNR